MLFGLTFKYYNLYQNNMFKSENELKEILLKKLPIGTDKVIIENNIKKMEVMSSYKDKQYLKYHGTGKWNFIDIKYGEYTFLFVFITEIHVRFLFNTNDKLSGIIVKKSTDSF